MQQPCWNPENGSGFLITPDPVSDLSSVTTGLAPNISSELEALAGSLPTLIRARNIRDALAELTVFDLSVLQTCDDFRIVERAFQIYSHFANAYVWCEEDNPAKHIPAGVAVPLVQLSKMVVIREVDVSFNRD